MGNLCRFLGVAVGFGLLLAFLVGVSRAQDEPGTKLGDHVTLHCCIEVEASVESTDGDTASDIVLATAQLGLDAEINDKLSASVVLLWEEDGSEPIDVDEGYLTFSHKEWTVCGGRLYVPFGAFNSHFVSIPLST